MNNLVGKREQTHGPFRETAHAAQDLKNILHRQTNWGVLPWEQREALDNICSKLARIACGNPQCLDHWDDVAGYAHLGRAGAGREAALTSSYTPTPGPPGVNIPPDYLGDAADTYLGRYVIPKKADNP